MAATDLRLYVFDCGEIVANNVPFISGSGEREVISLTFANRSYLIDHPEGLLLWDTGLSDAIADEPEGRVFGRWRFVVTKRLTSCLSELRLSPDDIEYLALSHLHLDHAGNVELFAEATVLVDAREYAAAFRPNPPAAYDPSSYAQLSERRRIELDGDYDVFGDGSVLLLSAPGHSAGHRILLLDLPRNGPVILSGDLYYTESDRALRRAPAWNFDRNETLRSMERAEHLIARSGAGLLIHHDLTQRDSLPRPPAYLD